MLSIDHERGYGKLPLYFKQTDGLDWTFLDGIFT